ncbi:hypothetical protein ABF70_06565, partial [Enterobacter hormaechei subsp. steigerwaltii]
LHGDVLMWLMKTLLTSGCTNQRGAGQSHYTNTWEKKGVRLLKRRFFAAMQDGSLEVGALQNRGT